MRNKRDFNNKIVVSEHGFNIGVNVNVNLVSVPTESIRTAPKEVPKTASKTTSKTLSKVAFKAHPTTSKLPHEKCVLSKKQRDELMPVSINKCQVLSLPLTLMIFGAAFNTFVIIPFQSLQIMVRKNGKDMTWQWRSF